MPRRLLFSVLIPLACLAGSFAVAQCPVDGDRPMLEVDGIGTATFDDFRTDRVSGTVVLFGDVCVRDFGETWTLTADRLEIAGLISAGQDTDSEGDLEIGPQLVAEDVTLTFPDWSLLAATANANQDAMTLDDVRIRGPNVLGTAESVRYDLALETATLLSLALQGTTFTARASLGVLAGDRLVLTDAVASTCRCTSAPPYSFAAPRAEFAFSTGTFVLEQGRVRVFGINVPLADRVEISEDLLDSGRLPFVVEEQSVARGDLGEGLTLFFPGIVGATGVSAGAGLTALAGTPRPVASLRAVSDGTGAETEAEATFALRADGIILDTEVRRDLGYGFGVGFAFHNRSAPRYHFLHQGVVSVDHEVVLPLPDAFGSFTLTSLAFAAVSAQRVGDAPVAGPRLGASTNLSYASPPTPIGVFQVRAGAASTLYPDHDVHQHVFSVAPSWRYGVGPFRFEAAHTLRVVDGGSPFAGSLDRVGPASTLTASAAFAHESAPSTFSVTARGEYDFLASGASGPGLLRLAANARSTLPVGTGSLTLTSAWDVAGFISDRARTAPFGQVGGSYAWAGHEVGTRVRYDLRSGTLVDLELSGRVRVDGEHVSLTPFLAVDMAPVFTAGSPVLSGHGLEAEWRSCCGTLVLGYEQRGSSFETTLSFRVDPRPLEYPAEWDTRP